MHLTPTQARVLGSLMEKDMTTPQYYPLTLKALVTACNQSNNRYPVMQLTEAQVTDALEALREKRVIRIVHPSHGGRAVKYRHVAAEELGLDAYELALLTVLLLRGAQTPGELRGRTERMAEMATTEAVEDRLRKMADREAPLVELLERQPGQKEARWADLITSTAAPPAADVGSARVISTRPVPPPAASNDPSTQTHPAASRPAVPRLEPVGDDDLDDQQRELLAGVGAGTSGATNIFRTLVRHPGLLRHWLPFGGKLLAGKLPARDRELLVLRTAWRCQAAYEWGHHAALGAAAGLTVEEIHRVTAGSNHGAWSDHEATLLRAADELHDDACISDATWSALANRFDERQLIEIPMLVGQYHLVSFALNSLGVQAEAGVAPLPDNPPELGNT
ncbi:MAG: DUF480 domain-containing protein [Acidimicrobiales bacterium]